jgi:hypothetical protein
MAQGVTPEFKPQYWKKKKKKKTRKAAPMKKLKTMSAYTRNERSQLKCLAISFRNPQKPEEDDVQGSTGK